MGANWLVGIGIGRYRVEGYMRSCSGEEVVLLIRIWRRDSDLDAQVDFLGCLERKAAKLFEALQPRPYSRPEHAPERHHTKVSLITP